MMQKPFLSLINGDDVCSLKSKHYTTTSHQWK